ncbi:MAG: hypothetical protein KC619_35775, partial [Myxococcales bacterium]|nr:hypothetical protein [Myxococcales bacterium]
VFGGDGWADVAAAGDGFVVAGVSRLGDGEHAFAAQVIAGRAPRPIARLALEADAMGGHRRASPAVAAEGTEVAFAWPDGERHLRWATFDVAGSGPLRPITVAEGASLQFSPTIARHDRGWLVAWTDQEGGHRRVLATRIANGRAAPPTDLTPSAGGAVSPSFVPGAEAPRLVYVDARESMSVIHRVDASGDAFGATEVIRPVSLLTDPPLAASVRMRGSDWLVYTGIGSIATTAVGLVPLVGSQPPTTLVPGTGYGVLYVDAAPFADGAVVATDVPTASPPDSPREVQLRVIDPTGTAGEPVTIRGPQGTAARVRVASRGAEVAVVFADGDAVWAVLARCAPP